MSDSKDLKGIISLDGIIKDGKGNICSPDIGAIDISRLVKHYEEIAYDKGCRDTEAKYKEKLQALKDLL